MTKADAKEYLDENFTIDEVATITSHVNTLHHVYYYACDKDTVACLILSQIYYWFYKATFKSKIFKSRKGTDLPPEHCIAIARTEWEDQCCVSPKQADRALKKLVNLGLIETHLFRFDGAPTTHIFLNKKELTIATKKALEYMKKEPKTENPITPKGEIGITPKGKIQFDQKGKTLTETTRGASYESPPKTRCPIGHPKKRENNQQQQAASPPTPQDISYEELNSRMNEWAQRSLLGIGKDISFEEEKKLIKSLVPLIDPSGMYRSLYDDLADYYYWWKKGHVVDQKNIGVCVLVYLSLTAPEGFDVRERIFKYLGQEANTDKHKEWPSETLKDAYHATLRMV